MFSLSISLNDVTIENLNHPNDWTLIFHGGSITWNTLSGITLYVWFRDYQYVIDNVDSMRRFRDDVMQVKMNEQITGEVAE